MLQNARFPGGSESPAGPHATDAKSGVVMVSGVSDAELARSPLHARHEALGAKFAEFGGWSMPLQYSGVVDEHTAVRERVGLFDVSHLGKASVTGREIGRASCRERVSMSGGGVACTARR